MTEELVNANAETWWEFRLILSDGSPSSTWQREHYEFIKGYLIPLVYRLNIQDFHVLNYFDPARHEDLIRFRVGASAEFVERIRREIEALKQTSIISDYKLEDYSPRQNAKQRIESVRQQLERQVGRPLNKDWKIIGAKNDQWVVDTSDGDAYIKKLVAFETFLTRILGRWTRIFVEEIDEKPEDRWLLSLFVHLTLNSLVYSGPKPSSEESEIRKMPPIG